MQCGDFTHEMIHGILPGCQHQMFPSEVGLSERLRMESKVEVAVAVGVAAGHLRRRIGGGDHSVGRS